jgi:hypothetical protein
VLVRVFVSAFLFLLFFCGVCLRVGFVVAFFFLCFLQCASSFADIPVGWSFSAFLIRLCVGVRGMGVCVCVCFCGVSVLRLSSPPLLSFFFSWRFCLVRRFGAASFVLFLYKIFFFKKNRFS